MTRKHKFAIITVVVSVLFACAMITMNNDYNTCRANGNSDAMCTGRG